MRSGCGTSTAAAATCRHCAPGRRRCRPSTRAAESGRASSLEADRLGRGERAGGQPAPRAAAVVLRRCDVVRAAGVEERRQHLDVPPADAELELAPAVQLDSLRVAMLNAL